MRVATPSELAELLALFGAAERAGALPAGETERVRCRLGVAPTDEACWRTLGVCARRLAWNPELSLRSAALDARLHPERWLTPAELAPIRRLLADARRLDPRRIDYLAASLAHCANHGLARQTLFELIGVVLEQGIRPECWDLAQRAAELDEQLLASVAGRRPVGVAAGAA